MAQNTRGAASFSLIFSVLLVGLSALLLRGFFHDSPPVDFSDIYLLFVLGLAYRYAWKFAATLAAVSVGVSIYILSPLDWRDGFELTSYAVCAALVIWIMASLRRRSQPVA
jgi:hypothetical protein